MNNSEITYDRLTRDFAFTSAARLLGIDKPTGRQRHYGQQCWRGAMLAHKNHRPHVRRIVVGKLGSFPAVPMAKESIPDDE